MDVLNEVNKRIFLANILINFEQASFLLGGEKEWES